MYGTGNYGRSGYGTAPPERTQQEFPAPSPRPSPAADERTPEQAFGRGIALASRADIAAGRADYPFDLVVGGSGDTDTVAGYDELTKDLAYRVAKAGVPARGGLATPNTQADIESTLKTTIGQDPRILAVDDVRVRPDPRRTDTLLVEFTALTDARGEYEGVFAVPPSGL